jgi:hypothetical protein
MNGQMRESLLFCEETKFYRFQGAGAASSICSRPCIFINRRDSPLDTLAAGNKAYQGEHYGGYLPLEKSPLEPP